MAKTKSPTQCTLDYLRKRNIGCDIAERTIPYSFIKKDLFGFIDVVATDKTRGIIGIQCTDKTNMSHRYKKIVAEFEYKKNKQVVNKRRQDCIDWLKSKGLVEVWGWYKEGRFWQVKIRPITLKDFEDEDNQ